MSKSELVQHRFKARGTILSGDLDELSSQELLELKDVVDNEITEINSQLGLAKSKAAREGKFSDPRWFQRMGATKGKFGRFSQLIQRKLGERRQDRSRAEREERTQSYARHLLDAMDMVLTPEQKKAVLAQARILGGN